MIIPDLLRDLNRKLESLKRQILLFDKSYVFLDFDALDDPKIKYFRLSEYTRELTLQIQKFSHSLSPPSSDDEILPLPRPPSNSKPTLSDRSESVDPFRSNEYTALRKGLKRKRHAFEHH